MSLATHHDSLSPPLKALRTLLVLLGWEESWAFPGELRCVQPELGVLVKDLTGAHPLLYVRAWKLGEGSQGQQDYAYTETTQAALEYILSKQDDYAPRG